MKYVSTLAFTKEPKYYYKQFLDYDIGIEFSSGGLQDKTENYKYFEEFDGRKIVHNYFPGYERDPFVLNLASLNDNILDRSITHCKNNILKTAQHASQKFFAVHAGFQLNVDIGDLGKPFANFKLENKEAYENTFIQSLKILLDYSNELKVDLYLENNVLIKENYNGIIPFFCVESQGIRNIFQKLESYSNFGLLLDTAHLKVSCQTLGLNKEKELETIGPFIKAIHHSDNDGIRDSNSKLNKNYWFQEYKSQFRTLPQVLEVKSLSLAEIDEQIQYL